MLPPALRGQFRELDDLILQIASSASERLVIVSPYLGLRAMGLLKSAIAVSAERGAWIRLVTAFDGPDGQNLDALTALVDGIAGQTVRSRLRILTGSGSFPPLLHAKILIADARTGYLGSANLSGRALQDNLEVGLALQPTQARSLDALIGFLEAQGLLEDRTDAILHSQA